jgi:hypothetical protein
MDFEERMGRGAGGERISQTVHGRQAESGTAETICQPAPDALFSALLKRKK